MRAFRVEDLPYSLRAQVERQLASDRQAKPEDLSQNAPTRTKRGSKMTATEREYEAILVAKYGRNNVVFEGLTLRMRNGHKYTPDFVVVPDTGLEVRRVLLVEVKGAYRLASYQRARLAFDQAAEEYPIFRFLWAEKQKDGSWRERNKGGTDEGSGSDNGL